MFNLIRRISYGVIPRADRPWEEDPTSNAPNTKRKRRLSATERDVADDDEERASTKKARGESATASDGLAEPNPQADTKEVKEVTKGVDKVTLDGKDGNAVAEPAEEEVPTPTSESAEAVAPESVPLPEDTPDELREVTAGPTPPRSTASSDEEDAEDAEIAKEEPTTISVDEASDIASSSGDGEDAGAESAPIPEPEPVTKNMVRSKKPVSTVKTPIRPETAAKA